jgi:hypothetical protein
MANAKRAVIRVGEEGTEEALTPADDERRPLLKDRHLGKLVQTRLGPIIYEELRKRANAERRDLSNYLEWWLEKTFLEHPIEEKPELAERVGNRQKNWRGK